MKSLFVLAIAVTTAVALVSTDVADAKRLGAGRSLGKARTRSIGSRYFRKAQSCQLWRARIAG